MSAKSQRIRDPLHNLIEFKNDALARTAWRVIQTQPFQRLRRIRQLGFSDFVFPGATHSRFAHSLGVFHLARQLVEIIQRSEDNPHHSQVAIAAALVHDVGHGMFSHAFEEIGKKLDLPMAIHENVSDALIRDSEITEELNREFGPNFAGEVANVIKSKSPSNLFYSAISSQFDADRLDYMQRDRLMTGVQGSAVDVTWILANLEVAAVPTHSDGEKTGEIRTLVLGQKAYHAAEHYVLSLFQLYPNVYLHKTTRGIEKLFSHLILQLHQLVNDGSTVLTGLPDNHPIVKFLKDPQNLQNALSLDDNVFWGALPLLVDAPDEIISVTAKRLHTRKLFKCIDIRQHVAAKHPLKSMMTSEDRAGREAEITIQVKNAVAKINQIALQRNRTRGIPILIDESRRLPYKKDEEVQNPLNQILIRQGNTIEDMARLSSVVSAAETFEVTRVYVSDKDDDGRHMILDILNS